MEWHVFKSVLTLTLLAINFTATAASFDCAKAGSKVEKLICANPQLSELDSLLQDTYSKARTDLSPIQDQAIVSAQKTWLKRSRNICADQTCLTAAYNTRINELDPVADSVVTCEEMQKYPERIFFASGLDLGSGHGSPIDFDYHCSDSLASLPFMKKLLDITEKVRNIRYPIGFCTGTLLYAQERYYRYDLAAAGFAPLQYLNYRNLDEASPTILDYFKQWSEISPENYRLYTEFFSEFDSALPALAEHYRKQLNIAEPKATEAARNALLRIVNWAAGSFPHASFSMSSKLLQMVRDSHTGANELQKLLADSGQTFSKQQLYQALKAALLMQRPTDYVKLLGDKLSATEIAGFEQTEEPLLSMAIASPDNLRYLLDKGVAVDSQNDFGKTALFYAIGLNNYPAVEILLQHKADVNHAYKSAEELHGADECVYPELLHTKRTPLMHAAQHADAKMIKLLLDHGAQLKAIDDQAYNAADYAAVAHKPENLAFLKSVGLEEALPEYTPNSTSNSLPIVNRLELSGSVYKLRMAANRPDILFASVAKANKPATEDKNGLYLLSLATPDSPKVIAQFPFMNIADIALSQDGKIAYVMEPLFNGAPAEKKFGLSIVDISDAEKPKLLELMEGDFRALHLSHDGRYLYLHEYPSKDSLKRGTLVYSLINSLPKLLCQNPFISSKNTKPLTTSYFTEMNDEPLLAINADYSNISVFNVSEPCKPQPVLSDMQSKEIGSEMLGAEKLSVIARNSGGLFRFQLGNPPVKIAGYRSQYPGRISINNRLHILAAVFGKEVALFKINNDGRFWLFGKFQLNTNQVSDVLVTDAGRVYMATWGEHGELLVGKLP
jgi:hypothetical protein